MKRERPGLFTESAARRWNVLLRGTAALFGGYAFAHALPIALVLIFPMSRGAAALTALQASFLFYLIAVLWCFAARSATAAWVGVLAPAALAGLIAWGQL